MPMKAADLPEEMKRNLLEQIRHQVGDSNYDRAVSQVGEDRFLDLCLEKAASEAEPSRTGGWGRWLRGLWWIAIPTVMYLVWSEKACSDIVLACFVVSPLIELVWSWISELFKSPLRRL
jgi:hypothetical protein